MRTETRMSPGNHRRRRRAWVLWLGVALTVTVVLGALGFEAVTSFKMSFGKPANVGNSITTSPSSYALNIVLSSDGRLAYVTDPKGNELLVFDTRDGALLDRVPVGPAPLGLAITPDGHEVWVVDSYLRTASGGAVTVVSTLTDKVLKTIALPVDQVDQGDTPVAVALSPSGRFAYATVLNGFDGVTTGGRSLIDRINVANFALTTPTIVAPDQGVSNLQGAFSLAVMRDGTLWEPLTAYLSPSTSADDIVQYNHGEIQAPSSAARVGKGAFFLAASSDRRYVYVADKESCDVAEISVASRRQVADVHINASDGCPLGIAAGASDGIAYAVTGDDHTLAFGHQGNALIRVDFLHNSAQVLAHLGRDPVTITTNRRGTLAYIADADLPSIYVVNLASGRTVANWQVTAVGPSGAGMSGLGGQQMACGRACSHVALV
jgi:DNA-binding beta-propeller fold protein YncE